MKKIPENIVLKFTTLISGKLKQNVLEIGQDLVDLGCDDLTNGGFWIWDVHSEIEFYSPNFRKSLGFEGEHDFPSVADSWMTHIYPEDKKIAIDNYYKNLNTKGDYDYYQEVKYYTKTKETLKTLCSGSLILDKNGDAQLLVGTHKIIE